MFSFVRFHNCWRIRLFDWRRFPLLFEYERWPPPSPDYQWRTFRIVIMLWPPFYRLRNSKSRRYPDGYPEWKSSYRDWRDLRGSPLLDSE